MMSNDIEGRLRNRCEGILKVYNESAVRTAFSTMLVLLRNIVNKPSDDNMRFFKRTNNAIKTKVLIIKETVDLLKDIGYTDMDAEFMIYGESDLTNVNAAIRVLDSCVQVIDKQLAEKEAEVEAKRQLEIKQQNEEIQRKFQEEKKRQMEIQKRIENDKREKAQMEKPSDSVGKKMDFGAKVCKFEPKQGGRG